MDTDLEAACQHIHRYVLATCPMPLLVTFLFLPLTHLLMDCFSQQQGKASQGEHNALGQVVVDPCPQQLVESLYVPSP